MNGADTLNMALFDYQASVFHWQSAHRSDDEPDEPPSIEEVESAFLRMGTAGIARLH